MGKYNNDEVDRVLDFVRMTDSEFYDRYVKNAPLSERGEFLEEFPEFQKFAIENWL